MATYTQSAGDTIAPGSVAVTELGSRVAGFIAGCGQAALAVLLHAANGQPTSPQEITTLIQQSVNAHVTTGALAASGESSPSTLQWIAQQKGVALTSLGWSDALTNYAGKRDIIIGVNDASAFGGTDSNVRGHYITVVGKTANGNYIVSDPNSSESTRGQYVVYSAAQIRNAQPFWAAVPASATPGSGVIGPGLGGATGGIATTVFSNAGDQLGAINNIANNLANLSSSSGKILSFFNIHGVFRVTKFVIGWALIMGSITAAFLPDILGAALTGAGFPEAGAAILEARRAGIRTKARSAIKVAGAVGGRRTLRATSERGRERGIAEHMDFIRKQRSEAGKKAARTRERNRMEAAQAQTGKSSEEANPRSPSPSPSTGPGNPVFIGKEQVPYLREVNGQIIDTRKQKSDKGEMFTPEGAAQFKENAAKYGRSTEGLSNTEELEKYRKPLRKPKAGHRWAFDDTQKKWIEKKI